jgi:hypothetical protein
MNATTVRLTQVYLGEFFSGRGRRAPAGSEAEAIQRAAEEFKQYAGKLMAVRRS